MKIDPKNKPCSVMPALEAYKARWNHWRIGFKGRRGLFKCKFKKILIHTDNIYSRFHDDDYNIIFGYKRKF